MFWAKARKIKKLKLDIEELTHGRDRMDEYNLRVIARGEEEARKLKQENENLAMREADLKEINRVLQEKNRELEEKARAEAAGYLNSREGEIKASDSEV